ncbi:MAG: helix-turn-helix domain containing protein [Candidatus Pacebacteria bacterium]|nr:helix-turn-helix domain containing protein [Candidatus Paceibacterota bacterium]
MARLKDREKALSLRKKGMSYSQIKQILNLSKSTLSLWLKDYPLSKQRIRELRDWNEQRIERYRETMRRKHETRLKQYYNEQKTKLLPLTKREFILAGLFLYWGEGAKNQTSLSISNTDPSIIKFFVAWLTKSMKVPKERLQIQLQLYNDMNIKEEVNYWSEILEIPFSQFTKPYIKKTSKNRINHKGGFGHGTCNMRFGNSRLAERVIMSLKVFADNYNKRRV